MDTLLTLIFCSLLITFSSAALERWPPQEKPPEFADQEGCYIPPLNRVLAYEVPYYPQDGISCARYVCHTNGVTVKATCGVINVGPNCKIVAGDKFLAYPDCCDRGECNEVAGHDDNKLFRATA